VRIPPRGFTNANFEAIQSPPVGYTYEDGAYSDTTEYYLPEDTHRVNVKLLYQTTSKEYVEFLRDENRTDTRGQELYDLWAANGKSLPEIMNEAEVFTDALSVIEYNDFSEQLKIFPNPAKDLVNIKFNLNTSSKVIIEAFNLNGAKIKTLHNGILNSKENHIQWETENVPLGVYIIKIEYQDSVESRLIIIE